MNLCTMGRVKTMCSFSQSDTDKCLIPLRTKPSMNLALFLALKLEPLSDRLCFAWPTLKNLLHSPTALHVAEDLHPCPTFLVKSAHKGTEVTGDGEQDAAGG